MRKKLKERWQQFKSGAPGRRFQDGFARRHLQTGGRFTLSKVLHIGGGTVLILVGIFLLAVPGPGLLFIAAGLGLLGGEFLFLARWLDSLELRLRSFIGRIKERKRQK